MSASELLEAGPTDVYVGISESGRSAETVAALRQVTVRRVGVTNFVDSAEVVDELLPMERAGQSRLHDGVLGNAPDHGASRRALERHDQ